MCNKNRNIQTFGTGTHDTKNKSFKKNIRWYKTHRVYPRTFSLCINVKFGKLYCIKSEVIGCKNNKVN